MLGSVDLYPGRRGSYGSDAPYAWRIHPSRGRDPAGGGVRHGSFQRSNKTLCERTSHSDGRVPGRGNRGEIPDGLDRKAAWSTSPDHRTSHVSPTADGGNLST